MPLKYSSNICSKFQQLPSADAASPVPPSPGETCSGRAHQTPPALPRSTWTTSWRWKRAALNRPGPPATTSSRGTLLRFGAAAGDGVAPSRIEAARADRVPVGEEVVAAVEEVGIATVTCGMARPGITLVGVAAAAVVDTTTTGNRPRTTLGRRTCGPDRGVGSIGTAEGRTRGRFNQRIVLRHCCAGLHAIII